MAAYTVHPGKHGKVNPGWHKSPSRKAKVKRNPYALPTPKKIRTREAETSMNKAAWIKLRARIDSADFNEAVRMAVSCYE